MTSPRPGKRTGEAHHTGITMIRNPVLSLALAGALLALGGCQANQPAPAAPSTAPSPAQPAGSPAFAGLGGTTWRLVEFQSMDDSQGTTRMADPGRYTISFNRDGRVAVRLDCNRGAGSWTSGSSNGGSAAIGGSLEFGPMAVTRALCPPPSFGERLEQHLRYVRSFVIRDGRLAMSLMADGGILVWEPVRDPQ